MIDHVNHTWVPDVAAVYSNTIVSTERCASHVINYNFYSKPVLKRIAFHKTNTRKYLLAVNIYTKFMRSGIIKTLKHILQTINYLINLI